MFTERRRHPRVRVLLDGHWTSRSSGAFYQLADLSLGGCFLQARKTPAPGQTGTITIYFKHDGPMSLEGEVVHVPAKGGFGFRFSHLTSSKEFQLSIQLETLKDQEHVDRFPVRAYVWKTKGGPHRAAPAAEPPTEAEEESDGSRTPKVPPDAVPIDGQWRTSSAGHFCRVLNVSLGGCFAKSPTAPPAQEMTTMTIYFGKHGPMSVKGRVVHAEPKNGFGFAFEGLLLEVKYELGQHLDSLKFGNY